MIFRFSILLLLLWAPAARAADKGDEALFTAVFQQVQENYIDDIPCSALAVAALKNIHLADKKVTAGDDGKQISLYHDAALVRRYAKPADKDSKAWAKLAVQIMEEAEERSPKLAAADWKLADIMLDRAFKAKLDKGSKYYPAHDIGIGQEEAEARAGKAPRFAARILGGGVLYARIGSFGKYSARDFREALQKHSGAAVAGMVLDLRGNPGGLMLQAVEIAQMLLDGGIIASAKGRKASAVSEFFVAEDGEMFGGKPIIVLVDRRTASSAELLAAALQEQGRARLAGERTLGKGSVQNLAVLPNGAEMALTSAAFFAPSGKAVDGIGLEPEIPLPVSPDAEAWVEKAAKMLLTGG